MFAVVSLTLSILLVPQAPPVAAKSTPATGTWHAWLDSAGGDLPFDMELATTDEGGWRAHVRNGTERIEIPIARLAAGRLHLEFDHYDSMITAKVDSTGRRLDGEWRKRRGNRDGEPHFARMKFHATHGKSARFPTVSKTTPTK